MASGTELWDDTASAAQRAKSRREMPEILGEDDSEFT